MPNPRSTRFGLQKFLDFRLPSNFSVLINRYTCLCFYIVLTIVKRWKTIFPQCLCICSILSACLGIHGWGMFLCTSTNINITPCHLTILLQTANYHYAALTTIITIVTKPLWCPRYCYGDRHLVPVLLLLPAVVTALLWACLYDPDIHPHHLHPWCCFRLPYPRVSGPWPGGSGSPRPIGKAFPWASAGTGPAAAGCPHTRWPVRPHPRSGTHPVTGDRREQMGLLSDAALV